MLLGFLLGLLFGSFLNVCISRLPAHRSVITPRSHCNTCGALIAWYDNIPILSWLALRAHCRHCDAVIPWRYPAVEFAFGLWFALCAGRMAALGNASEWADFNPPVCHVYQDLLFWLGILILGFLLIGLMVMDWQTQRLPDAFTVTGIVLGFALACVQAIFHGPNQCFSTLFLQRIAAIAAAALILLLIRWIYKALRKQEGMGLGDVKMLAMIAAFLGLWTTLVALFAAVITASIFGIGQLTHHKAHATSRLPFGSFLAAGGLFAALFGSPIVAWYMTLLR